MCVKCKPNSSVILQNNDEHEPVKPKSKVELMLSSQHRTTNMQVNENVNIFGKICSLSYGNRQMIASLVIGKHENGNRKH